MQNQLGWTGQCSTVGQVLVAQLNHVMRTRAGQRKRFKEIVKHHTTKGQTDINAWEVMAADCPLWRRSIYQATAKFETNRLLHEAEKRLRRKDREMYQRLHVCLPSDTSCPHCYKICRSRIRLLSH